MNEFVLKFSNVELISNVLIIKGLLKKGPRKELREKSKLISALFYPGIMISKDGVVFHQSLEKAILFANARRMLPTLAGIPLDMQLRSSAALKVIAAVKMTVAPSLMSLLHFKKFTGVLDIKPR